MTLLQLALDLIDSRDAADLLREIDAAVDVVEAGTPMIKREGMDALRRLRGAAPSLLLVADMKTMDAGAYEAELAFGAGANLTTVLGCASDATVEGALAVARDRGGKVVVDLIGVADKVGRARALEALGVDYLGIHAGTDEQSRGADPLADLAAVSAAVSTSLAVAGGITLATLPAILALRPAIVIVGSGITRAADPIAAAFAFKSAIVRFERGGS